MDYKKTKAPNTTVTRDLSSLEGNSGNIYETIAIVAKRSDQISIEIKRELDAKLEEFASYSDNLEEMFENREQIEISKFYERLPNPALIALQEFEEGQIYYRKPSEEDEA